MPRFEILRSTKLKLTCHSGLALIGQCCEVVQGMKTSDMVKTMTGLLSLGKSDVEAVEPFRTDRLFIETQYLTKVPSSAWMRRWLYAKAKDIRDLRDELSVRLLERTEAPITPHKGYMRFEINPLMMDNSDAWKEDIGRAHQGVDGHCPTACYLGYEVWDIRLELRAGTHHSALETEYFHERRFPRVKRLVKADQAVLKVEDRGFDSARLLFAKTEERDACALEGRVPEFLSKWNPRKLDKAVWVAQAGEADTFKEVPPGKRVALLDLQVEHPWRKAKRTFRLIVEVTESTMDKRGQYLLVPQVELLGRWTCLALPATEAIEHYRYHGTHEQFHPEIKSDLDLELLPSGKFDTNNAILGLGEFAHNCLCLFGQLGLTGEIATIRHPAKHRRLTTVSWEIMYRAAKFSEHTRSLLLDLCRSFAGHLRVFVEQQDRLLRAASP